VPRACRASEEAAQCKLHGARLADAHLGTARNDVLPVAEIAAAQRQRLRTADVEPCAVAAQQLGRDRPGQPDEIDQLLYETRFIASAV